MISKTITLENIEDGNKKKTLKSQQKSKEMCIWINFL